MARYSVDRHKKCRAPFKDHPRLVRGLSVKPLGSSKIVEDSDARYNFTKDTFLCSRCRTRILKIIDTQGKFKWETQVETETTSEITVVDPVDQWQP